MSAASVSRLSLDPIERVVSPFVKTSTVYLGQDMLVPLSCVGSAYLKWQSMTFTVVKQEGLATRQELDDLVEEEFDKIKLLVEHKRGYHVKQETDCELKPRVPVLFSVIVEDTSYCCEVKSIKFSYGWERADSIECLEEGREHARQIEADAKAVVAAQRKAKLLQRKQSTVKPSSRLVAPAVPEDSAAVDSNSRSTSISV